MSLRHTKSTNLKRISKRIQISNSKMLQHSTLFAAEPLFNELPYSNRKWS